MAAGAGDRSARGGASGPRGLRDEGRGRTGDGAKSEGRRGLSDEASDAEKEGDGMTVGRGGGEKINADGVAMGHAR